MDEIRFFFLKKPPVPFYRNFGRGIAPSARDSFLSDAKWSCSGVSLHKLQSGFLKVYETCHINGLIILDEDY